MRRLSEPSEEQHVSIIEQPAEVDGDKLQEFVFRAVEEVGATLNAALVVMGDKLGLYRALAGAGGLSSAELADRTGTAERLCARVVERAGSGRVRSLRRRQRHVQPLA